MATDLTLIPLSLVGLRGSKMETGFDEILRIAFRAGHHLFHEDPS